MSNSVLDVHRRFLTEGQDSTPHRFINKYDDAYEYLQEVIDADTISQEFQSIPIGVAAMFRVATYAPRDYLILQTNPDLDDEKYTDAIHGMYHILCGENPNIASKIVEFSRTGFAYYLAQPESIGLKIILQAVDDILAEGSLQFDNIVDNAEFRSYFNWSQTKWWGDTFEPAIGPEEGFYRDFAYTNAFKYQAGKNDREDLEADDLRWLLEEIAAIQPKYIIAMGEKPEEALEKIGFDRFTDYVNGDPRQATELLRFHPRESNPNVEVDSQTREALNNTLAVRVDHIDSSNNKPRSSIVHDYFRELKAQREK